VTDSFSKASFSKSSFSKEALKGQGEYKPRARRGKLTYQHKRLLSYFEQFYVINDGKVPTNEQVAIALGWSVATVVSLLEHKDLQKMLERRGIPWAENATAGHLTPTQVAVAVTTTNFADTRPLNQKLDSLGVLPAQYQGWLQEATFRDFVNECADKTLQNVRPQAVTAFAQQVASGDLNAFKYFNEITGQFSSPETQNLKALLQLTIETIQRHVKDPKVLAAIAQDLLAIAPGAASQTTITVEDSGFRVEEDRVEDSGRSNVLTG
jgi:hypothetical protein